MHTLKYVRISHLIGDMNLLIDWNPVTLVTPVYCVLHFF